MLMISIPTKRLLTDLGESVGSNIPKPIIFVKSHQDLDKPVCNTMAEYNPDVLLPPPPHQKGERHRVISYNQVLKFPEKENQDN